VAILATRHATRRLELYQKLVHVYHGWLPLACLPHRFLARREPPPTGPSLPPSALSTCAHPPGDGHALVPTTLTALVRSAAMSSVRRSTSSGTRRPRRRSPTASGVATLLPVFLALVLLEVRAQTQAAGLACHPRGTFCDGVPAVCRNAGTANLTSSPPVRPPAHPPMRLP
jgi:hypothetical protein